VWLVTYVGKILHGMLFVFVKLVCVKWRLVSAIIAAFENVLFRYLIWNSSVKGISNEHAFFGNHMRVCFDLSFKFA